MCKRNFPDKNEASTGCVRETPQIKNKKISQHGLCKRISPGKKELPKFKIKKLNKKSQHGMCKRNTPQKNKASVGCVIETPQVERKPAWDV